ncbi:MAG: hypothetical protein Q7R66_21730 [Undibacterium sp.]|uniref:hypothetical protein n=1 Tax=Undibacterium sp. TaxID=1914977 RepID=UPI0027201999|nr:hypothetical protein [Undibacterium sp.]MDO8654798.1 hypothetical protein [Undibacterium sp.]
MKVIFKNYVYLPVIMYVTERSHKIICPIVYIRTGQIIHVFDAKDGNLPGASLFLFIHHQGSRWTKIKQQATSNKQQATSNKQQATSNKHQVIDAAKKHRWCTVSKIRRGCPAFHET